MLSLGEKPLLLPVATPRAANGFSLAHAHERTRREKAWLGRYCCSQGHEFHINLSHNTYNYIRGGSNYKKTNFNAATSAAMYVHVHVYKALM